MKKIAVFVLGALVLGTTFAVAAPKKITKNIISSQIVQGKRAVSFAGANISVPQGQTILLGQRNNGSIVIRGNDLNQLQIDNANFSTKGYSIISYQPNRHVAFLNRGELLTVTDADGNTSSVAQSGAISTTNATINSDTAASLKQQAEAEAKAVEEELGDEFLQVPAFVAQTATSNIASEQAELDVEETVSKSAPH